MPILSSGDPAPGRAPAGENSAPSSRQHEGTVSAERRTDLAWLLLLGIIWGTAFPVIRFGEIAGASPLSFALVRLLLSTACMAAIALATRDSWPDQRTAVVTAAVGGGFVMGGYAALLYVGESSTGGGLSAVLVGSVPLWSAILAYGILPSERFGRWGTLGIAVGFAGLIVLFYPDLSGGAGNTVLGSLLVVGAALSAAIGSVLLRRLLTRPQRAWGLTIQFGAGTIVVAAASALSGAPLGIPWNRDVILSLAYLAGLSSVAGYAIYFHLHHRIGPARANVVTYVNPLAGLLVGVLLLSESVSAFEIVGFGLVVAGLVCLQRDRARRRRSTDVDTITPAGGK